MLGSRGPPGVTAVSVHPGAMPVEAEIGYCDTICAPMRHWAGDARAFGAAAPLGCPTLCRAPGAISQKCDILEASNSCSMIRMGRSASAPYGRVNIGQPMQAQATFSILLVDDDTSVIRIMSHILTGFATLRFATSGRAALDLARAAIPDLVFLDVEMPDLGGFEVCKAFKSDAALMAVPIVFVTGHTSAQMEVEGRNLGAVDFLRKPPDPAAVLARVRMHQLQRLG